MNYCRLLGPIAFILLAAGCGANDTACSLVGSSTQLTFKPPAIISEVAEFDMRVCHEDLCNTSTMIATDSGFEVKGCVEECDPQAQEEITLPYVPWTSRPTSYTFTARDANQHTIMTRTGTTEMGSTAPVDPHDRCGVRTLTSRIDLSAADTPS